jgi:hypothetical protein
MEGKMAKKSILERVKEIFSEEKRNFHQKEFPFDSEWSDITNLAEWLGRKRISVLRTLKNRGQNFSLGDIFRCQSGRFIDFENRPNYVQPDLLHYKVILGEENIDVIFALSEQSIRDEKNCPKDGYDFIVKNKTGSWWGAMDTDGKVIKLYLMNKHSESQYEFKTYETIIYESEK